MMIEASVAESRRGFPPCLFQECAIMPVGHGRAPDGEASHPDSMGRALVRRARLATHQELALGDDDHFRLEVHEYSLPLGLTIYGATSGGNQFRFKVESKNFIAASRISSRPSPIPFTVGSTLMCGWMPTLCNWRPSACRTS